MSVQEYSSTKTWVAQLVQQRPHMTVQNYLWGLQVFCDWAKKNPDELVLERQGEMTGEPEPLEAQASKRILSFQANGKLKTKHSREMIVTALASFYENNKVGLQAQARKQ
ncbi:MAG: hypothetical protein HYU39_02245 [Thaumarchaeota archaeon]|nr:hypothetical protein [Nitrososphaerota archaeon]